jgi:hypothetical protein
MISVIIASADPKLLAQVRINVEETIGLPYEVLAFDNRDGAKGICEIYNEGIVQAKFDLLCFMHEDIAFETKDWGKITRDIFDQHPQLGIIGIAGSTYKSIMPTGWASQGSPESERSNLLQSFKYITYQTIRACVNPNNEQLAKVVAVDGAWMCVRREVCNNFLFDNDTFKKFHCYDLDFCLSVGKQYEIAVTYDILLNHFSEGKFDHQWMEQTLLLFEKWEKELPRSTNPLTTEQVRRIEKQNFRYWVKQMRLFGFPQKLAYQMLHRRRIKEILGLKYYLKFHYSIFAFYHLKKKKTLL